MHIYENCGFWATSSSQTPLMVSRQPYLQLRLILNKIIFTIFKKQLIYQGFNPETWSLNDWIS